MKRTQGDVSHEDISNLPSPYLPPLIPVPYVPALPPPPPLPPLPQCDGPKLGAFAENFEDLKFEPELVNRDNQNVHGIIIKAKLDGKTYCVKFFTRRNATFFNPNDYPELTEEEVTLAMIQSDPFFAECRAYGRLKEEGVEHLAAKAYGYIELFINDKTEKMFRPVRKLLGIPDMTLAGLMEHYYRDADGFHHALSEGVPIYGIVKEWAGGDKRQKPGWRYIPPFEENMEYQQQIINSLPQQLETIHELHKNGIVVRDLHADQWIEGKLVDFSFSMTWPHVLGQGDRYRPDWTFASYAARDLQQFQNVVEDENDEVDFWTQILHHKGINGPFKKSDLVPYPPAPKMKRGREGLRPLRHRVQEYLPLLLYYVPYDPDSIEIPEGWAPWTHGL